jgi:uncharacterized membrane protein
MKSSTAIVILSSFSYRTRPRFVREQHHKDFKYTLCSFLIIVLVILIVVPVSMFYVCLSVCLLLLLAVRGDPY